MSYPTKEEFSDMRYSIGGVLAALTWLSDPHCDGWDFTDVEETPSEAIHQCIRVMESVTSRLKEAEKEACHLDEE